jgi:ABC-type multidrug transport system fused ATPase/permease subunit
MSKIFNLFGKYLKEYPFYFSLLMIAIFVQAIGNSLSVFAVAPVTDLLLNVDSQEFSQLTNILISRAPSNIDPLLLAFIFFISSLLFAAFFSWVSQHLVLLIKFTLIRNILSTTLDSFYKAKYSFFSEVNRGEILNSFQRESDRMGDAIGHFGTLFANSIQGMIFLFLPFYISTKLTLIFIGLVLVVYSPFLLAQRYITKLGQENTTTGNKVSGFLNETLSLSKVILVFAKQNIVNKRFNYFYANHAEVAVKFKSLVFAVSTFFVPLGMGCAILTIYIGFSQGETLTSMTMILFSFFRLMPVAGVFLTNFNSIIGSIPSFNQIELLKTEATKHKESSGNTLFQNLESSIELKNISFSYQNRANVLENISLEIKRGSRMAIVGQSGSGKSTLMDILMGLYLPSAGEFLLNNKNIDQYDINSYREKVGYVPQESNLFEASIRDNLLWANPAASQEDIDEALKLSNAYDFIQKMPNGIDTQAGFMGNKLSGGQKQRLALARALIIKPEILFLDEATSSLDIESEQYIKDAINSLPPSITVIVIAHRLSAIENCDYYFEFKNGKVIDYGSIAESS